MIGFENNTQCQKPTQSQNHVEKYSSYRRTFYNFVRRSFKNDELYDFFTSLFFYCVTPTLFQRHFRREKDMHQGVLQGVLQWGHPPHFIYLSKTLITLHSDCFCAGVRSLTTSKSASKSPKRRCFRVHYFWKDMCTHLNKKCIDNFLKWFLPLRVPSGPWRSYTPLIICNMTEFLPPEIRHISVIQSGTFR
jgi:hypothetical protein